MPIFTTATRCFEEVARSGSVRRAAEHLHLSASAVNRQILRLEAAFGVELFERLPRGMRLTTAGEMLITSLKRQQRELQLVFSQVDELKGLRRGHVVIASLQYIAQAHLARFIADFRQKHPGITFTVLVGSSREVENLVLDGTAEIGICYEPRRGIPLAKVRAFATRLGVAVHNGHPLAGFKSVKLKDCLGHPVVLPIPGMDSRGFAEQLNLSRLPDLTIAAETSSFPTLIELIKTGAGIGFLTDFDAVLEVQSGGMCLLPLLDANVPAPLVCTVFKQGRTLSFATALALEMLGDKLQAVAAEAGKISEFRQRQER